MRATALTLAALVAATGLGAGAEAATKPKPAPKPVCNLITDAAGDAVYNNVPGNDSDDIVGGDLATSATTMSAVIRVKKLTYPDPQWATGRVYSISFTPKGSDNEVFLAARTYPQGVQYILGHRAADPTSGINTSYKDADVTGSIDAVKGEIRINAPMSELAKLGKLPKGTVIKGMFAKAERIAGQGFVPSQTVAGNRVPLGGFLFQFDLADASKPYTVGSPSCVKP